MNKWDKRFLDLAEHISNWSLDPSTKVGAVIVDNDKRIISLGYNGFAKGIEDNERLNDRDFKMKTIIHAEMNSILFASRSLENTTLYTYPFSPCHLCASHVIQVGIKRIVSYNSNIERWKESFDYAKSLFDEAKVELKLY